MARTICGEGGELPPKGDTYAWRLVEEWGRLEQQHKRVGEVQLLMRLPGLQLGRLQNYEFTLILALETQKRQIRERQDQLQQEYMFRTQSATSPPDRRRCWRESDGCQPFHELCNAKR